MSEQQRWTLRSDPGEPLRRPPHCVAGPSIEGESVEVMPVIEHEAEVKELRIEVARLKRKAELSVHHQVGVSTPVTFEAGWKSHAQTLEARLAEITAAAREVLTAEEAIEEGARDFDRTGSTATTVPAVLAKAAALASLRNLLERDSAHPGPSEASASKPNPEPSP